MTRMPRPLDVRNARPIETRARPALRRPSPPVAAGIAAGLHLAVFVAAYMLEPAPTDTEVAWQWLGELVALGYLAALGTAFATVNSARTSLIASFTAGAIGLGMTIACPATGHHAVAGWWYAQLGLFTVATAAPILLGRRVRR